MLRQHRDEDLTLSHELFKAHHRSKSAASPSRTRQTDLAKIAQQHICWSILQSGVREIWLRLASTHFNLAWEHRKVLTGGNCQRKSRRKQLRYRTNHSVREPLGCGCGRNWAQHCASCHGKDGSGSTTMGKKLNIKDYRDAKVQAAFRDAEAERAIQEGVKTSGKETMKPFGSKVSRCRHQGTRRLYSFLQKVLLIPTPEKFVGDFNPRRMQRPRS